MAAGQGAQSWRLVRLVGGSVHRCQHCGQPHEYLTRPAAGGVCRPVILPPGFIAARSLGTEVEVFNVGPVALPGLHDGDEADDAYQRVARRVAAASIRCERCGERFEDLGAYDDHPCD